MASARKLVSFDWAMKRLLRSKANFDILEGFLSELLHDSIKIVEILDSESNKETPRDKFNRLDLKCKNHQGEIILIEVQYQNEIDFLQRVLFGVAKALTEHFREGQKYADIIKVYSIAIVYFDLGQGSDYIYHGTTVFKGMHKNEELELSPLQREFFKKDHLSEIYPEIYVIKVKNFDDIAKNTLDEWIYFLKNEEIKDGFRAKGLKKAKEKLDVMKMSEKERQQYEAYLADLSYQASMVDSSYGVGRFEGRKEGREEGRQEGREEGRQEGLLLAAGNMLEMGLAIGEIAKATGLSVEVIEKLKKSEYQVKEPAAKYRAGKKKPFRKKS